MDISVVQSYFQALGTDIRIEIIVDDEKYKKNAKKNIEEVKEVYFSKQKIFCRFNPVFCLI